MTWRIEAGDARAVLAGWPAGSVQCVITSVPYYNLRSYSTDPQVWGGRDDCAHEWGSLLPARKPGQVAQTKNPRSTVELAQGGHTGAYCLACGAWRGELGSEPTVEQYVTNLVQVFRAVRRVLAPTGTLFLNIGDSYSNAGRAGSRGTKRGAGKPGWTAGGALGDKQLLLIPARVALALQADGWILRSEIIWHKLNPMPESVTDRPTKAHEQIYLFSKQARYYYNADAIREPHADHRVVDGKYTVPTAINTPDWEPRQKDGIARESFRMTDREYNPLGRNKRDVWSLASEPFPDAHFATMPTALVEPCILAGSRPGDVVADPFTGAGTVGVVALRHGRGFWGAELNSDYVRMATERIIGDAPLFNQQQEGAA